MGTYKKSEYLLQSMLDEDNNVSDKLRVDIGGAWIRDADGKFKPQNAKIGAMQKFSNVSFSKLTINQEHESFPYYSITQSITLTSDDSLFDNYKSFLEYINGTKDTPGAITTGSYFTDAYMSVPLPYSQKEKSLVENSAKPQSYSVAPVYNFYQRNYEDKTITVPEQILPNLYSVYASKSDIDESPNALNDLDEELLNIGTFLGDIVDTMDPVSPEVEVLPIENIKFLDEANPYKSIFPMYNEVEFSTQRNTVIAQVLEDADLSTSLLKFLSGSLDQSLPFAGFREELSLDSSGKIQFVDTPADSHFKVYDIFEWVEELSQNISSNENNKNIIGPAPAESNKFIKFLNLLKFEARMEDTINSYLRSYQDILEGIPSYSETVAYKVEKRRAGTLVSTYLFPNSNEIDVYKFVDTQVKYGEKYDYSAYAYQLVFGAEYVYGSVSTTVETNYTDFKNPIVDESYIEEDVDDSNTGTNTGTSSGGGGYGRPAGFGGFMIEDPSEKIEEKDDDDFSDFGEEFAKEGE